MASPADRDGLSGPSSPIVAIRTHPRFRPPGPFDGFPTPGPRWNPRIGSFDAAFRIVVGIGGLVAANHGWTWAGWLGAVLLVSAVTELCPALGLLRLMFRNQEGRARYAARRPGAGHRGRFSGV